MRTATLLLTVSSLVAPAAALADGPDDTIRDLQCLVGSWSGDGQVELGEATHDVHFTYTCREAAGGAAVACHLVMTGIPEFTYESDDLWGVDPGTGRVHWFTVTNAGETHDHAGRIEGDAFAGTYTGVHDGRPMRENVRFRFDGRDRLVATSEVFVAHRRQQALAVTMNREAPRHAQADVR